VHLSEARVSTALDKLAYMEALVNDKLLPEQKSKKPSGPTSEPETSSSRSSQMQTKPPRRCLNVSGPVKPYNPCLKNFWYPVAFSTDLKEDTMVILCFYIFSMSMCHIVTTHLIKWETSLETKITGFCSFNYCLSSL
jgi:chlorophyllide a oxygenase